MPLPSILDETQELSQLDSNDVEIWPKHNINDADLARPFVVLLHGLSGDIIDMTDPLAKAEEYWAYDVDDSPPVQDEHWHSLPPSPLDDIDDLQKLGFALFRGEDTGDAILDLLGDLVDFIGSPEVSITDPSWFSFFRDKGFPVLSYSQQGPTIPLDDENGAYAQFRGIMQDIHEVILGPYSCRKIALVGHSRGGLMARRYIVEALKGELGPVHEQIVEQRVRFLGSLNSPHWGTMLGEITNIFEAVVAYSVPIPIIAEMLTGLLLSFFGIQNIQERQAKEELSPVSDLIVELIFKDFMLLGLDVDFTPPNIPVIPGPSDIRISLSGDPRMKRIRRASTGGDQPVLRRYYTPYVYTLGSYSCIPSVEGLVDSLIPDPFDPLPKCFHHKRERVELPFSPIIDETKPLSLLDWVQGGLIAPGLIPPIPVPFPELHASRPGIPGGDSLVSALSAIMPYSAHRNIPKHHGHPLWDPGYKSFIESQIPISFCYPLFEFRLGDNIVELDWDSNPHYSQYRVVRFEGDSFVGVPRSPSLTSQETLYYDLVEYVGMMKYLISYQFADTGDWAHEIDELAFMEAVSVGSCPVTIKNCQPSEGQEAIDNRIRLAASMVGGRYIVFSVSPIDLLSDCIGYDLVPLRDRLNITQNDVESEEEDQEPQFRFSEPYASTPKDDKNHCIAAWVEYAVVPLGGDQPGTTIPWSDPYGPTPAAGEEGGPGLHVPGVVIQTDLCQYLFRLKAGIFDEDGVATSIKEIIPLRELYVRQGTECYFNMFNPPIEPPRFVSHNEGFVFAATGGSPYNLYIVSTDTSLTPEVDNEGNPDIKAIEIFPSPPPTIPGFDTSISPPEDKALVLHDLFPAESEGRFIALVTRSRPAGTVFVVNFTPDGSSTEVSTVSLDWGALRYQGAVLKEDPPKLILMASSPEVGDIPPQYATFTIEQCTVDSSTISFKPILFPDLREDVRMSVQEVLRRCDTVAEFLVSTTGYFRDSNISSSLFRVTVSSERVEEISIVHHSGFGDYKITFTRSDYYSSNNGVFWQAVRDGLFVDGIYGQPLSKTIPKCDTLGKWVPGLLQLDGVFGILMNMDKIIKILCPRIIDLPWGPEFCDIIGDPDLLLDLVYDPRVGTQVLVLIGELDKYARRIEVQSKLPKELQKKIDLARTLRPKLVYLLDNVMPSKDRSLARRLRKLAEGLEWESPYRRAKKSAESYMGLLAKHQGTVQFLGTLLKERQLQKIPGIGIARAQKLRAAGIRDIETLLRTDDVELGRILDTDADIRRIKEETTAEFKEARKTSGEKGP